MSSSTICLGISYILHQHSYRDDHLLFHVLSQKFGRIRVFARGVRKSSRFRLARLQAFRALQMEVIRSKQQQFILTRVEPVDELNETVSQLRGRPLYCGYYVNELLLYLLPEKVPCESLLKAYQQFLLRISFEENNIEQPLRFFELCLLQELGYGPNWIVDIETQQTIKTDGFYFFDPQAGPYQQGGDPTLAARHPLIGAKTLFALEQGKLEDSQVLKEAKILLRHIFAYHLNNKKLKSRDIFRQLFCH